MADIGSSLGEWRLLRLLESGSVSTVFIGGHVEEQHLLAAIKVLNRPLNAAQSRLYREQKKQMRRLDHPHLIRLLDVDVQEGEAYLAMEYAPYGSLRTRHPAGTQVPPGVVLAYLEQIAPALQYLHDEELVQRDIKPGKFLVGRAGQLLLGDNGPPPDVLRSVYGSSLKMTESLPYMAPERLDPRLREQSRGLEAQADQYALAVVLYEWLTGKMLPQSRERASGARLDADALALLRRSVPSLKQGVEDVLLRALAPDPLDRFDKVEAFAQAFARACLPITASSLPQPDPDQPYDEEQQPMQREQIGRKARDVQEQPPARGRVRPQPEVAVAGVETLLVYTRHRGTISGLAWSPDGNWIASASGDRTVQVWEAKTGKELLTYGGHRAPVAVVAWASKTGMLASAGVDGTVQVWTVDPHRVLFKEQLCRAPIWALAWSPDGHYLAVGLEQEVHIWNVERLGEPVARYQQRSLVRRVAWSPRWSPVSGLSAAKLASGGEDSLVHIWQPGSEQPLMLYRGHHSGVSTVAWSPNGQYVASGGTFTVQVWDAADGRQVFATPISRSEGQPAVAWRPQEWGTGAARHLHLAVTGFEATVEIWDVQPARKLWLHRRHAGMGLAVAWSPDGALVASGGFDQQVQVWRPE